MKVCLVNVRNCINYSQYSPFFFEHIKKDDCVIYNDVSSMDDLGALYEFILAEINRDAFSSDKIKLIFFIPRDMISPDVEDYEFFNEISIYTHILSKLKVFSEVSTICFDNSRERTRGENNRKSISVSDCVFTDNGVFSKYLPVCTEESVDKQQLKEKIEDISCPVYKEFFLEVLDEFEDAPEFSYCDQFKSFFRAKCREKLGRIIRNYVFISPDDIASDITETLRVVYFIKELIDNPEKSVRELDDFRVDHSEIKKIIATYKYRMERWRGVPFYKEYEKITEKKIFRGLERAGTADLLSGIVEKNFDKDGLLLDVPDGRDYVDSVFEKLGKIVFEADDKMRKFVQEDVEIFRDEDSYDVVSVNEEENPELEEKRLLEKVGSKVDEVVSMTSPGITEQIYLEQWLESKRKEIDDLKKCTEKSKRNSFFGIFLFNFLSVAVLYFIAQYSVFVKDNAFWIYGLYCLVTGLGFLSSYASNEGRSKKSMDKLIEEIQIKVRDYLCSYEQAIKDFEENLNNVAAYLCQKKYVDELKAIEARREEDIRKFEWHKQRVDEILLNLRHFDDYTDGVEYVQEGLDEAPDSLDDDIEHTGFYQMKIFARG